MSKISANNYENAKKQIAVFSEVEAAKLPTEIAEADKGHYVVALVRQHHNPTLKRYETSVSIQQFDNRAYAKLEKGVEHIGFDNVILLHDPTVSEQVDSALGAINDAPAVKTEAELRAEIRAEIEAENKAKAEKGKAPKATKEPKVDTAPATGSVNTGKADNIVHKIDPRVQDVSGLDEQALNDFATANGVDFTNAKTIIEKQDAIRAWQVEDPKTTDVTKYNVTDLKAFADLHEIDLQGANNKTEVLDVIKNWQS